MTEVMVDIGGATIWTERRGKGPPLQRSSGGPGCCDYLEPISRMVEDLATFIRWEQRGCGRSDAIRPYDQATCISDMEALRQHFGYEKWIDAGHSWGANLVLAFACEHPGRVNGIIYLAGTGITENWKSEYRTAKQERREQLPVFAYPYNPDVNMEGNLSRTQYLQNLDIAQRVRDLNVPVLIAQGELDMRQNWAAKQLADLLPNSQYEVIMGAEHWIWLTHEMELRILLRRFVEELIAA